MTTYKVWSNMAIAIRVAAMEKEWVRHELKRHGIDPSLIAVITDIPDDRVTGNILAIIRTLNRPVLRPHWADREK